MTSHPIILGIDPGFDRVGWAVGQKNGQTWKIFGLGVIQTNSKLDLLERYQTIILELEQIITKFKPDETGVEEIFFSKNTKTALKVSEARGIILSCLLKNNLAVYNFNPNQIKLAVTGYGKADKKAVEKMVRLELKLAPNKMIDDALDAAAVMITHQATRVIANL